MRGLYAGDRNSDALPCGDLIVITRIVPLSFDLDSFSSAPKRVLPDYALRRFDVDHLQHVGMTEDLCGVIVAFRR